MADREHKVRSDGVLVGALHFYDDERSRQPPQLLIDQRGQHWVWDSFLFLYRVATPVSARFEEVPSGK